MTLHIYKTVDDVLAGLADYFVQKLKASIAAHNECTVVLSGGSSPEPFYELLSTEPYRSAIDWSRVFFFFADERYVPFEDPANNGRMAARALFEPLGIGSSKINYIPTELKPEKAAKDYADRISRHFKGQPIRFDIILLGLGEDAHTASLFPQTKVLYEHDPVVSAIFVEKLQSYRITMTPSAINAAHAVAFLVYGENKALAAKKVIQREGNPFDYPAQLVSPENGSLDWYLDESAASFLGEA